MDKLFILQLISSFLVGGGFIALISFAAERACAKTAGIIISLPSTIAIGFFFMGLTISPESVAKIAPILPLTIGSTIVFTTIYLYLAKFTTKIGLSKIKSILLCVTISTSVWLGINIPFVIIKFTNLAVTLSIYIIFTLISYYFLTIRPKIEHYAKPITYSLPQKIWRASFVGIIICLTIFLARVVGPFWGAIFSSFPAVYLSTLVVLHFHYNSEFLFKVWKNAPLGLISPLTFALSAIYTFPKFGTVLGTISAYLISLVVFIIFTNRHFTSS